MAKTFRWAVDASFCPCTMYVSLTRLAQCLGKDLDLGLRPEETLIDSSWKDLSMLYAALISKVDMVEVVEPKTRVPDKPWVKVFFNFFFGPNQNPKEIP